MQGRGPGHQRIQRVKDPGAVAVQHIKGTGAGQHLQRALADAFHVHPAGKVEQADEGLRAARLDDHLHRLDTHVLERAQRIDDLPVAHAKGRQRGIDAGGHDADAKAPAHLFGIGGQLVSQVDVAVHHGGHELHRVVRLQPGRLIADHRIGGRMGFVEAIVCEFLQQVKDLARLRRRNAVGLRRALDELRAFLCHFLGNLLAHRAPQQVRPAQAVSRHDLGNLHHLFLIDDDPLGFFQDMVDGGVDGLPLAQAVLDLAIGRDVFHRTGAVQRHQRHDILDAGRLHAPQRIHHAAAFHLEHRHGSGGGVKPVGPGIVQRDQADVDHHAPLCQQIQCILDHRQRLQPQEVELHQPGGFDPLHVELGGRHV